VISKSAARLIPGVFYNYYAPRAGQLCGQYIVVPLSDFDGKPLHARTPKGAFKLRLNRTEVVRRKANCVLPIFPLKKRYNLANYSLEGQGGAAIDVPNQGYDDVPDDDTRTAATEDVVYDSQLYDYVLPASKTIDALSITAKPDGQGVVVEQVHPIKYLWDHLPLLHGSLTEIFPEDIRQPPPIAGDSVVTGDGSVDPAAPAVDPDTDIHQSPFPASSGVGEDVEDTTSRPESITEIDILKKLLQVDFCHSSWTNFDTTTWQSHPGVYLVYKSNNTVNMPQINGRGVPLILVRLTGLDGRWLGHILRPPIP